MNNTEKLQPSRMVIGCMRHAELSVAQMRTMIEKGLEYGINAYDHADIYGKGQSEEVFGKALKEIPSFREKLYIQTKCVIRPDCYDFSKEHILKSVEASMKRLQLDYLDALLLHRPDTLMEPEEVAEAFDSLHKRGLVRDFGVSNHNPMQIELLQQYIEQSLIYNQLQFSLKHTPMIDEGINVNLSNPAATVRTNSILEYSRLHKITIQAWSVLQYGFFEGTFLNCEKFPELNAELDTIAKRYQVTSATIAIAWILRHPANMQAIIGSTNVERIAQMSQAMEVSKQMTRQEWYALYRAAGNMLP